MTTALPADPTGADLVAAIEARARALGTTAVNLAERLSRHPWNWLKQTGEARRPKPATIARVKTLLADDTIPAAPPVVVQFVPLERRAALSPSEGAIYHRLVLAAERGQPCPRNSQICDDLGMLSSATVSAMIGAIEMKGWIRVERGNCRRVVTIVETGARTAGKVNDRHWRLRPQSSAPRQPATARARASAKAEDTGPPPPAPIASREPCFRCGVRGDIGCRHQPLSFEPELYLP
ncbi:MAG: MarR family winged helix-turn-helix transcriptional regulator [Novosphingobium sp.]